MQKGSKKAIFPIISTSLNWELGVDSQLREMSIENRNNGLPQSLTSILEEMNRDHGGNLDPEKINLAELERRTGITRSRLRRLKKQGFVYKREFRSRL